MIILGIESATQQVGCAIGGAEGVFAQFQSGRERRHAETLVPAIDFICDQAGIALGEIGVIAVDVGPGLYTGLRVGVTTAKTMAYALRIPMLAFTSLDLLALPMRFSERTVISVIDAKRGEIFVAYYRSAPGGVERITNYLVTTAEKLAIDIEASNEQVLLVGDGAMRYRENFTQIDNVEFASINEAFPQASAIVTLAQQPALNEQFVQPSEVEPLYLRKSDAEINWTTARGAAQ